MGKSYAMMAERKEPETESKRKASMTTYYVPDTELGDLCIFLNPNGE